MHNSKNNQYERINKHMVESPQIINTDYRSVNTSLSKHKSYFYAKSSSLTEYDSDYVDAKQKKEQEGQICHPPCTVL